MANERARTLRKNPSDAEYKLWQELRLRQLDGMRFRRQHPIGPYIVDFVCLAKRLIIEVDGEQHTQDTHVARDERRDRWLAAKGYRVMRFQTIEVYESLDGVADTIWAALQEMPSVRSRKRRRASRGPHGTAGAPPPAPTATPPAREGGGSRAMT
jgi:very-short-patch-repair endonuclease